MIRRYVPYSVLGLEDLGIGVNVASLRLEDLGVGVDVTSLRFQNLGVLQEAEWVASEVTDAPADG